MQVALDALRAEHFRDKVGQIFMLEGVNGQLPLKLMDVQVGDMPMSIDSTRLPFGLTFRAEIKVNIRQHELFNLRHPVLGLIEGVFIGPIIAPPKPEWGRGGVYWHAGFN